jgi:hypothetical protein
MLTERQGELILTPVPAGPAASVRGALSHLVKDGPTFDEERAANRRDDE